MISLKRTKKDLKKDKLASEPMQGDSYPWGTRLEFGKEEIEKIPALKKVDAGDVVQIKAVGKVMEVSSRKHEGEKESRRVEIQIEKIEVSGNDSKEFDAGFEESDKGKKKS